MDNQTVRRFAWVLAGGWMIFIFALSHQGAGESASLSGSILEIIINGLENLGIKGLHQETMSFILRKSAHFTIYLILGVFLFLANGKKGGWGILVTVFICGCYAITDEWHQTFIGGRSGEMRDVLIDTLGGTCGALLTSFLRRFK